MKVFNIKYEDKVDLLKIKERISNCFPTALETEQGKTKIKLTTSHNNNNEKAKCTA